MEEEKTWGELAEKAEKILVNSVRLDIKQIEEHGRYLDGYIEVCSGKSTLNDKVKYLSIKGYNMDRTFYRRITVGVTNKAIIRNRPYSSSSVTIICYVIAEREKCSAKEVCSTLVTLGLFSKGTKINEDILNRLRDEEREALSPEQIKESISNDQVSYELQESIADHVGESDNNSEDTQLNITQYTDKDDATNITEEQLKTFVTGFIESFPYKITERFHREHSRYSELCSVCWDELYIFHPHTKTWEYVLATYFASGIADEEIQQEMKRIHNLERRPQAFVIVACATEEILGYVQKHIAADRKKSIVLLCYKNQDQVYIYPAKSSKSDKKRLKFLMPDSPKYVYK